MKTVVALILCGIVLATLAACGASSDAPSPDVPVFESPPQPSEPVTAPSDIAFSDADMKMSIELEVDVDKKQITVSASMAAKVENNEFSFYIGSSLTVDEISGEGGSLEWQTEIESLEFRGPMRKVTVTAVTDGIITAKYHGSVSGAFNFIDPEAVALSFYSSWYPQGFPYADGAADQIRVTITGLSEYTVLRGEYDGGDKAWTYHSVKDDPTEDCNIIAFKPGSVFTVSRDGVSLHYLDEAEAGLAENILDYSLDALAYYNEVLYPDHKKEAGNLNIVSFSYLKGVEWAYSRAGLIVYGGLSDIDEDIFMKEGAPHELAHFWANGADTSSWEDWLNETCANWSALLYLLHIGDQDAFDQLIEMYLEYSVNFPPIKTVDGGRPNGVHNKGTVLFYELYKEHGGEMIEKLLNIFVSLPEKNTESFINEVSSQIGNETADFLQAGLLT